MLQDHTGTILADFTGIWGKEEGETFTNLNNTEARSGRLLDETVAFLLSPRHVLQLPWTASHPVFVDETQRDRNVWQAQVR